jgi:hypothetical protein
LGGGFINASGALRGEVVKVCPGFHVIASGAKQSIFLLLRAWIASLALAMTTRLAAV